MNAKKIILFTGIGIIVIVGIFAIGFWTGRNNIIGYYDNKLRQLDQQYASITAKTESDLAVTTERARTAEDARAKLQGDLTKSIATSNALSATSRDISATSKAISESSGRLTSILTDITRQQQDSTSTDSDIDRFINELATRFEQFDGYLQSIQNYGKSGNIGATK